MIQILGIRYWFDAKAGENKKKDEFFRDNWRAPSVLELLSGYEAHLDSIPVDERYNIFFTQAQCGAKKREFKEQWVIPWDIDGIDVNRSKEYLDIFCSQLGILPEIPGIIFSGHGFHLMLHLPEPFTLEFFKVVRPHYAAICEQLNHLFAKAGLPGHMDQGIFKPTLFFRMPGTENRKEGLPPVPVVLWQVGMVHAVSLAKLSGLPDVDASDQIKIEKKYFKPDTEAVLSGCEFLKHCKQNPGEVDEPQWYAMLSIVGRLDRGQEIGREYSIGHKSYSEARTDVKIAQSIASSGPRTCKNINALWGKCNECPNFEKVPSPISLKGPDHIATQDSGFHTLKETKFGLMPGKPCFEDLRKFFEKAHSYKVMGESGICYVWQGTHYEPMGDAYLKEYAQAHFSPQASMGMRTEFADLICSTNLTPPNWFQETTEKRINFKNGVFDLRTGELSPHQREMGFRHALPFEYDEYAKCPIFEKFLTQVTGGDRDLGDVLLEYVGYAFSGDFPRQGKVLVLTGNGSNGKSTFLDLIRKLGGPNCSSLNWSDIRNTTTRLALEGKLFNVCEESPKDAMKDTSFFKNISTGGEITVKKLYKQPYQVECRTKFIFACNELPTSDDTTAGFFRRFLIVPFNVEFSDALGNVDKGIREKLYEELPGIFNLVRRGYDCLTRNGRFTEARASSDSLDRYKMDTDHATRWIKENVSWSHLNGGARWIVLPELYGNYRTEMLNSGESPVTAVHFGKKLGQVVPEYDSRAKVKKIGGKAQRVLLDCRYQSDENL